MTDFDVFKTAVADHFKSMCETGLFVIDVDKDKLYQTYLGSFPDGTNPIFKERTEHDCNCCKSFIRTVGNVVTIVDGEVVSIWDVVVPNFYQEVANAMSAFVKADNIKGVFLSEFKTAGTDKNYSQDEDGNTLTWYHFHVDIPKKYIESTALIGKKRGRMNEDAMVLHRSVFEITKDAADIVSELIAQGSLYRGEEHKKTVNLLVKLKKEFDKLPENKRSNWVWSKSIEIGAAGRIRNTVIGTLLTDISEGKELEAAVKSFEAKVAPANYKRPTALVTKGMIQQAQKKVAELGLQDSLQRRHAVVEDISVNDVLFVDRSIKKRMDVFDDMIAKVPAKTPSLKKVEEIGIDDFIANILPKADSLELLVENRHSGNFMSLLAPENKDSKCMLKWGNNFSWNYNGEVADSMRERVVAAGGRVDGDLRFTHSWNHDGNNQSLMDLHVFFPSHSGYTPDQKGNGVHDKYGNKNRVGWNNRTDDRTKGVQDVDYTSEPGKDVPIENITFPDRKLMPEGVYILKIHNWKSRKAPKSGFKAEVEIDGTIYQYDYPKPLKHKEWVTVAKVTLRNGQFSIEHCIPEGSVSTRNVWGIDTNTYVRVNLVSLSPNHWNGNQVGNKHYMFFLDGCRTDDDSRGFYNEFLMDELTPNRKVFEVLASKMKVGPEGDQLSGLGFSSTKRDSIICRVKGSFNREVKINF